MQDCSLCSAGSGGRGEEPGDLQQVLVLGEFNHQTGCYFNSKAQG